MSFAIFNFLVPGLLIVISYSKILQVCLLQAQWLNFIRVQMEFSISRSEVTLEFTPAQSWLTPQIHPFKGEKFGIFKKFYLCDCYNYYFC